MTSQVGLVELQPVRLLPLAYGDVDELLLLEVERLCKASGVSLDQIELLGQDARACEDFLHVAREVSVEAALVSTDWLLLEELLRGSS